ncbi:MULTISPECIES: IS701 family transposase [unclassified Novosphingobium]|uniref:IS701 family transposase n=1 Tax=unclassified Novosphingobium TaxID=2644732 RepID=UPI0012D1CAC4|nr:MULTISPECIES: IS701 family transposase [unclassified Novosphingobium]MPS71349.1 IS701 family transposase [Novosphingobium sp.]WRT92648.1 IS701 family transposase [Novosphingobium sp. RL4]WRT94537.1 IS701 family transposase [Novosphingobium sp. RL4]WRT95892.1 IS701 family transposase [Novosphingobium sp. RL4]
MDEDWQADLERWLEPYLGSLANKTRRRMCPAYIAGLIGPGDRKSIQPMAARTDAIPYDRLHHFIGAGLWDSAPLEAILWSQADQLVGGNKAWLIIDDTALPKKGKASVGVAPQYATVLGKNANCQTMVSVTLASGEVPIMLSLRLFLPESWTDDAARMTKAGVPEPLQSYRTKPEIAVEEIDRAIAAGVRFGCVLADAGYGLSASFRQALTARDLCWAVGIPRHQKVYPADVQLIFPVATRGRPRVRHVPDVKSRAAHAMLEDAKWRQVSWRRGTKGMLSARFAAMRVRIADGAPQRIGSAGAQHMPGEEVWLVGEHRSNGERKYYLSNLPAGTSIRELAGAIKARWVCEQAHQQLKEELGLDHFEGRSWTGLHRHALMTMMAYAFLQTQRLAQAGRKKKSLRAATSAQFASSSPSHP